MVSREFPEYQQVYNDSKIDIRLDPKEQQGYVALLKEGGEYIFFPRGTLEEVALQDTDEAKRILDKLIPITADKNDFPYEHVIAAVTKAHYVDKERIERGSREMMEELEKRVHESS